MRSNTIYAKLSKNEEHLKSILGQGLDINYRRFAIPALGNCSALIVFINGMVDEKRIDEFVLAPLMKHLQLPKGNNTFVRRSKMSTIMESSVYVSAAKETNLWNDICDAILNGDTVLFADGFDTAGILSVKGAEARDVAEPLTESEIRGPRDGFVENIEANIVLIRRRIKDPNLRFENLLLGERTKTNVTIAYIKDLAADSILQELKVRLNRIEVDSILESGYIEELIKDSPVSIFPTLESTERPDKVSAALLEGRIAVLTDTTPFALILPTVFWNFLKASGDYYENIHTGILLRFVRSLALFLSTSASSFYVLMTSFHQEMIPTALALKIAGGRHGVPFPSIIEAAVMEIILEVMKEAGLRMPKPIGQTVSVVGTLVIGQAAVAAGFISPALVIVIAVSAVCAFAIPSYALSRATTLIRFPLLFATAFLGILGYMGGVIVFCLYLLSLRSFGEPFVAPVSPFDKIRIKDVFSRAPWWRMQKRTKLGYQKDSNTVKNLKPKPPE